MHNDRNLEERDTFLSIAIVEHHQGHLERFDTDEICLRLGDVWQRILARARAEPFSTDAASIMTVSSLVTTAFEATPDAFRDEDDWKEFISECGDPKDGPVQFISWMFSALYWNHLQKFRLATTWMVCEAMRLQLGLPPSRLPASRLGAFLESLSASGPPLYDGQTFYPDSFSE